MLCSKNHVPMVSKSPLSLFLFVPAVSLHICSRLKMLLNSSALLYDYGMFVHLWNFDFSYNVEWLIVDGSEILTTW